MSDVKSTNSQMTLVIDVGGTNIKLLATGQKVRRRIPSGPAMTAAKMVELVKQAVGDWKFDRVSIGFPGPVINSHPLGEPANLVGAGLVSIIAVLSGAR